MPRSTRSADSSRGRRNGDTAERILDSAEKLVRTRGFNGFSYADVAGELGITKASLHYHFAGKSELGSALIARYTDRFGKALEEIDARTLDSPAKLAAYADLYADALRGGRMCLCGMLAAEYETLPKPIRDAVIEFFDDNERWLAAVLEEGRAERTLSFEGPPTDTARMLISSLEGAMLVARPYSDPKRFKSATAALLASVAPAGGS